MRLNEEELRKLTLIAINKLGEKASPELVKKVISKTVDKMGESQDFIKPQSDMTSGRIILTAFGLNKSGVVASITSALSQFNCDIRDLSQKIMDEFFTMIMIVDISNSPKDFREIQEDMSKIAGEMNIKIFLQHEDIFRSMHRI